MNRKTNHDGGWQYAAHAFFKLMREAAHESCGTCGYLDNKVYIPSFLLTSGVSKGIRMNIYGKCIIIENAMESIDLMTVIEIAPVTDFEHPCHERIIFPEPIGLVYKRTTNLMLSLSQARKFVLEILPRMGSRSVSMITLHGDNSEAGILGSFGHSRKPNAAFLRSLLDVV